MASTPERQSSFDDFKEFVPAFTFPIVVKDEFEQRIVARAFRVEGGGDVTVKTGSGASRTITSVANPYYLECKIMEITSATSATKIVVFV